MNRRKIDVRLGQRTRTGLLFLLFLLASACTTTVSIENAARLHKNGQYGAAEKMLLVLAASGDVAAQARLGTLYASGATVRKDFSKAFHWQLKAAAQGHVISQYNVAVLYARGKGTNKNYRQAVHWFRQAAKSGMPQAQLHMGLMREKGWGLSRCPYAASNWYYRAGQTFIEQQNLKMAQHAQQEIQRILPGYYLARQLRDEIFLSGGKN